MADEFVLDDLQVLELGGGVAAAMAARFLHGYGARVTRFEPNDVVHPVGLTPSQRIAYLSGVEVVAGPASELVDRVAAVDMIVTDRQPSELGLLGLDFAALRAARPEVIVVSVTPFGLTGRDADLPTTNAVSFAAGGIMSLTGDADRPPVGDRG
ncbi:CoA transferase [bacterium]|nr:CoA transferase [bacterium]